ncbi:uncharacterized protein B0H64DRAFT_419396 [Chaetomium fimeti]|uniref:DUF6546 domain-containing protein n=1 Tax=Chaetomium fimeti TaxID=1854472 RepID=A0AAE0LQI3_9PEZI|nr:hypothetical protein B0H64DRAFT_419396 [Chaetomium fimeti]
MAKSRPWASLPAEILMILEEVSRQKDVGWASLASVCKEWQFVIARENFRQLKLRPSCLMAFERLIVLQRQLIRYIHLEIELPRYSCRQCTTSPSMRSMDQESLSISHGIWSLLRILGTWELANNGLANGVTLELSAYSPSDTEHWFKNYHFTPDADGNNGDNCKPDDPVHGWINGQQVVSPPATAIPRLFSMVHLGFQRDIPQVVLPPSVERLPNTLKKVSVFEDFSDTLATILVEDQNRNFTSVRMQVEAVRIADPQVGAAFASRSRDLEQLSVSYMVNAEDFFGACLPSWTWLRLESLALTSQLLYHGWERRKAIDALFYVAGMTALRMPRLRNLAIWNGREGNACAFIYYTDQDYAHVTWRGTWEMDLSPRVVEVWERVALESRSCPLRVTKQEVQGVIGSHGDAIHRLALPCLVVDPKSLWQIRREGR